MSFKSVKLLDIAWSIVIGRGGQVPLLWTSYRVYRACLIRLMETTTVPYSLYISLGLGDQTLWSIWEMTKYAFRGRGTWRHRILMAWLTLSLAWVMCWQVFTDAMTSYASSGDAYIPLADGSYTPIETFFQSRAVFRVKGLDPLSQVKYEQSDDCHALPVITEAADRFDVLDFHNSGHGDLPEKVPVQTFQSPTLPQTLNAQVRKLLDVKPSRPISADVVGRYMSEATDLDLYINRTDLPSELVKSMDNCIPFDWHSEDLIPMIAMSAIDRVLYDYRYPFDLRYEYLVCDNKSNGYQWGFSYWMMLVFASLHGGWILGTFVTWTHTQRKSYGKINRTSRKLGPFRALLDLSEAIREELGSCISGYGEDEIAKALESRPPVLYVITKAREGVSGDDTIWHLGVSSTYGDRKVDFEKEALYG